jgi:hypothetical protein
MPEAQHPEERPCLHCMMVEVIEDPTLAQIEG